MKKKIKTKKDCIEILFAGFGGQGIMFMGKLLAQAGLVAGKYVTWMPSYGAEVRGGTAYSMAKVSNKEIASPIVTAPDILIVMNKPSLLKYEDKIKENGMLILNKSLVDIQPKRKDITVVSMPMTDMAHKLGNVRCANMVAVGALLKKLKIISTRNITDALKGMLKNKEQLFLINKKAFDSGLKR